MEWAIKERTMKAIDTELTKFLGAEAQYYVPIYQRKYSWKKDNCLKLIDDILKVAKDNDALIYDNDEARTFDFSYIVNDQLDALEMDDYVYYFSFEFRTE